MKKRLRKKLHVKEFFDAFIEIAIDFIDGSTYEHIDEFVDNLILYVDLLQLALCGSNNVSKASFAIYGINFKHKLTQDKVTQVLSFIEKQVLVKNVILVSNIQTEEEYKIYEKNYEYFELEKSSE